MDRLYGVKVFYFTSVYLDQNPCSVSRKVSACSFERSQEDEFTVPEQGGMYVAAYEKKNLCFI